jgi:hypothetical protein
MTTYRGAEDIRRFDTRGAALTGAHPTSAPRLERTVDGGDRVDLPLGAWRRRARPQSNVITLRIPSWASSSSKP